MTTNDVTGIWQDAGLAAIPNREPEDSLTNYASSLWKLFACARRAYLERNTRFPVDDSWRDTAEHGNWVHEGVVDRFKKAGVWRGDEVRGGNTAYNLSYRIDLLIDDSKWSNHSQPHVVPVEVKSVNSKKYTYVINKPDDAHLLQLQCYLHFHRPRPYPYGYLLYYNRDNDNVTMLKVEHDAKAGADIENALLLLETSLANCHLPPSSPSKWNCRFCPCKLVCTDTACKVEEE